MRLCPPPSLLRCLEFPAPQERVVNSRTGRSISRFVQPYRPNPSGSDQQLYRYVYGFFVLVAWVSRPNTRFTKLANDIAESAPRFREWFDAGTPELEKLPLDWRELDKRPFQKLLVVRCLRPDRTTQVWHTLMKFPGYTYLTSVGNFVYKWTHLHTYVRTDKIS